MARRKKKINIKPKKLKKNLTIDDFKAIKDLINERLQEEKTDSSINLPAGTMEVDELDKDQAMVRIDEIIQGVVKRIQLRGESYFNVPQRSSSNIIYDEIHDLLLLGKKKSEKNLLSLTSAEDATRLMRVIELVYELLEKDIHATKREIFYGDVNLFKDQRYSDNCIEDASTLLRTTRNSTHVVGSAKGSAIGRLRIRDRNDIIDLTELGSGGWSITPMLDKIEVIESDAEFILVLEKDAAMIRLAEARYWRDYPCIILTGKGAADIATRQFLRKINNVLKLPTLCLVDADPYGHYIFSVYIRGSKRLSYESPFIATPDMHLLGVLCKDLEEYSIPDNCRIPMNKQDKKRLDEMLSEDFVKNNKKWVQDLKLMKQMGVKAEIQALSSHGFEYLTETYLPNKIESADWI